MIRGAGDLGKERANCEDRMEEADTGSQGKGGRQKIQEKACLYPRNGCGDGPYSRRLELCSSSCRLEMEDHENEGAKMALRTEREG